MAEHAQESGKARDGDDAPTQAMPGAGGYDQDTYNQGTYDQGTYDQGTYDQGGSRTETAPSRQGTGKPSKPSVNWREAGLRITGLLATLARWAGLLFAAILVLHVIFVIGDANQDNGIVTFVNDWSQGLALGFEDLFTPEDAKLRVLVNYGIAALFWLIVSSVLARIIRRVGGAAV
jgi:hypothetical protein